MARPIKLNADYFSHDADMRNDPKIKALRRKYKNEGYAIWNYLLEVLTDAEHFQIEWNELNKELLSGDFDCETELLNDIIEYCLKLNLLVIENEFLMCSNLSKRFAGLLTKRKTHRNRVMSAHNTQSKVKESKVNKSIVKNIKDRKADFKKSLHPFLEKYQTEILNDFFSYWTEHGEKDKKMRFEKEKSFGISRRLSTWAKNQKKFDKPKTAQHGNNEQQITVGRQTADTIAANAEGWQPLTAN